MVICSFINLSGHLWIHLHPLTTGLGTGQTTLAILLSIQYTIITSYSFLYLGASLTSPLSWRTCEDWWGASIHCSHQHQHLHDTKAGVDKKNFYFEKGGGIILIRLIQERVNLKLLLCTMLASYNNNKNYVI